MLELCIDTSAGASVAIVEDGAVLSTVRQDDPRQHAESLAVLVQEAAQIAGIESLPKANWGRVNVGTGPAPFTGLRAGLVTAQVFASSWGVPIYGLSSLEIVGRQSLDLLPQSEEVIAVTDARRKEVYWARYRAAGPDAVVVLDEPQVSRPEQLASVLRDNDVTVVGPGAPIVQETLGVNIGPSEQADAAVLSRLVQSVLSSKHKDSVESQGQSLSVEPLYLRRPDVSVPKLKNN